MFSCSEWYNNFKKSDKGDKMEMVFVSSDRDETSFNDYYKEMPWHALPYSNRDLKVYLYYKRHFEQTPKVHALSSSS